MGSDVNGTRRLTLSSPRARAFVIAALVITLLEFLQVRSGDAGSWAFSDVRTYHSNNNFPGACEIAGVVTGDGANPGGVWLRGAFDSPTTQNTGGNWPWPLDGSNRVEFVFPYSATGAHQIKVEAFDPSDSSTVYVASQFLDVCTDPTPSPSPIPTASPPPTATPSPMATATATSPTAAATLPGDADCNGLLAPADALTILKIIGGLQSPPC